MRKNLVLIRMLIAQMIYTYIYTIILEFYEQWIRYKVTCAGLEPGSSAFCTDVLLTEPPDQLGQTLFTLMNFKLHDNNYLDDHLVLVQVR